MQAESRHVCAIAKAVVLLVLYKFLGLTMVDLWVQSGSDGCRRMQEGYGGMGVNLDESGKALRNILKDTCRVAMDCNAKYGYCITFLFEISH